MTNPIDRFEKRMEKEPAVPVVLEFIIPYRGIYERHYAVGEKVDYIPWDFEWEGMTERERVEKGIYIHFHGADEFEIFWEGKNIKVLNPSIPRNDKPFGPGIRGLKVGQQLVIGESSIFEIKRIRAKGTRLYLEHVKELD